MVQSVYLPFARLGRPDQSFVELGELSAGDAEVLKNPQLGHLVLMDFSSERVDQGLAELSRLRIPHRLAQRHTLGSRRFGLAIAHVILDHPADPLVAVLPATALRAGHGATIRYDAEGATLTTGTVIRNWDGIVDLAGVTRPGVPVTVTMTLRVLRGRAGLVLIRPGQPDRVLQENLAPQTHQPIEVSVRSVEGAEPAIVALRNWMEDGTRAAIRVSSVTVRQPPTGSEGSGPGAKLP
jgi:hypothetical protein